MCQSFPGILSNKNKAQKTYVDILFGYLQYQWEIWTQNYGTDCDHFSGDMFTKFYFYSVNAFMWLWMPLPNGFISCYYRGLILLLVGQTSVLFLFNSSDRLSYSDIMTELNLTDNDVVRLLHSLSCAKYKILNKEPNIKTISPTDCFEFNSKFTDKMRRIKVLSYFLNV